MGRNMTLNSAVSKTQNNLSQNEKALAEGVKVGGMMNKGIAQNYKEIANAEEMVLGAETRLVKIGIVKNRVDSAARLIDKIIEIAKDIHVTMTSAQQAGMQDKGFGAYCERKFDELVSVANQRNSGGGSMLGGAQRDKNPIDPTTGDFQGEANNHAFTIEGVKTEYGFHAGLPAIQDLFDVLKQGKSISIDDLGSLQGKMQNITKGLTSIKREVDEQMIALDGNEAKAKGDIAKYKQIYTDLVGVDEMQTNLEAATLRLLQQALLNQQIEGTKMLRETLAMARSVT